MSEEQYTIDPRLDNYDWAAAFEYADPDQAVPGLGVSTESFCREDVEEILYIDDGFNDGDDWIGVFRLRDGRFARLSAWCDYSGWG